MIKASAVGLTKEAQHQTIMKQDVFCAHVVIGYQYDKTNVALCVSLW